VDISAEHIVVNAELKPRETARVQLTIQCEHDVPMADTFDTALSRIAAEASDAFNGGCRIRTSNHQFNNWLNRSLSDVHMMTIGNPEIDYPYAGVPWFSTVFGRDGILTAMECLWQNPRIAKGVLHYLAATQALEHDPATEADPGKIVHETRHGEMAALGEIPFGRYYGSVDSTPLFVMLAGLFYQRTGDLDFIRALWPHIDMALSWMDLYGDSDRDGFVEYERRSSKGLIQQGWKDSSNSVFHADGALAEPPIALCEVQGYVYAARTHAAVLAAALGDQARAKLLASQATDLQQKFEEVYWCEELSTYGLALDRRKDMCRVRTSNAGHCLFSRIASPARANQVAQTLLADDSFSGWGVRTVSSLERNYNPISYHNGSVWPHDNAIVALGMAQYGLTQSAAGLLDALFEASSYFEMNRLPELICGLHRRSGEGPTLYPVACSPQAWSAGAAFMLLQASLGMSIDAPGRRIVFNRPTLPDSISSMRIENLQLDDSMVNLLIERHAQNINVEVLSKKGRMEVIVSK
jgi:glycogen debranching enzyme